MKRARLASSSTLTTEEWKAEQQLERDAQASTPVPVKTMRLASAGFLVKAAGASANESANSQVPM